MHTHFFPLQKWLEDEFLVYLQDWEKSVEQREGKFSRTDKNKMLLSRETREGLYMTGKS
ncbi:hypothetical protein SPONN_21 [uncultured Candidatus Thioglobus sp.]|nr:hypothetical protein SPONN_21 [uncultured Candidatus Thioglobus sp.]